ncbi:16S rRNA (cytosine(967)-C(5))-methyltransferase RsmB [Rhodoferax sp.]|uniref:16S rRNA (cytosine(967)-C(5))-methyltransferase RsmB n=1 Tax=Rhodoferax sp. TaxID=50421 RepID=UPI00276FACCA|nr:16S rRNA (cytosine(967)-C(5))-methyltransferase RsmB [Rhodoferax sp.]
MIKGEQTTPLWRQLLATALVVQRVRGGASATVALGEVTSELRPGVQALSFQVLRHLGRAQSLRRQLAARSPAPATDALLCTALALAWNDAQAPYESFTLVNQTVEAAKSSAAHRGQANFVNACLRRFLREREALVAITDKDPLALWNHPQWWIDRLKQERPTQWQAILAQNNHHAPMTLRVNARQSTVQAYLAALSAVGIEAAPVGVRGVVLTHAVPVQALPGFAEGMVSVQDAAAQLAAPLLLEGLSAQTGRLRVLDACAAPGGKTVHLLEMADCEVIALDVDPLRCDRIQQTLRRVALGAQVVTADAANLEAWWDGRLFDAVLLDAPCTASGIVRRHPDVRWLRRESDIGQLATIQARLLRTLWTVVKPGGRLLYCTCSVFKAEGQEQIETFLAHNSNASLRPSPGHLMPQSGAKQDHLPDNLQGDHDGFYYALLEKCSA